MTGGAEPFDRSTLSGPSGCHRNPSVSVVLATYNGERFLGEQLESLSAQNRLPDELIVVDDASTDLTPEILHGFARSARFPVETISLPHHMGTSATFEEGLRRAEGDVVLICDQDDRWAPDKVAVMAERLSAHPKALLAFSDAVLIDSEGRLLSRSRWRVAGFGRRQRELMAEDPLGQMLARQIVSGCTAAIRRELVPALLPFPEGLHPALKDMMYDRWISLVAAAAGEVITIPERLVEYRIHPDQQIGIPALPVRRVAPRAALEIGQFRAGGVARAGRSQYHAAHMREISKRLESAELDSGEAMLRLRLADRHLTLRGALPTSRWRRSRQVGRHYLDEDGYRRFALGLATAVADWSR